MNHYYKSPRLGPIINVVVVPLFAVPLFLRAFGYIGGGTACVMYCGAISISLGLIFQQLRKPICAVSWDDQAIDVFGYEPGLAQCLNPCRHLVSIPWNQLRLIKLGRIRGVLEMAPIRDMVKNSQHDYLWIHYHDDDGKQREIFLHDASDLTEYEALEAELFARCHAGQGISMGKYVRYEGSVFSIDQFESKPKRPRSK